MKTVKNITLLIATLLTLWLIGYVVFAISAARLQPQSPAQKVDAIIILTGGQGRIETGLGLFAAGNAENVFITGVHPYVKRSEIRALWKEDTPLPNCCIMLGYEARTTQQNAQETKAWLATHGHSTIRLVTGNFHMPRALGEFRHSLSDIEIIPHPIEQPRLALNTIEYWRMAFYEYHKSMFRWVVLPLENYLPDSIVNLQLNPEFDTETGAS